MDVNKPATVRKSPTFALICLDCLESTLSNTRVSICSRSSSTLWFRSETSCRLRLSHRQSLPQLRPRMDTHLALSFPDCFSDPDADTEPMSQDFPVFKDDCAPQQRFQGGQWIQNSPEMPESQRSRDTFDQEGRDLGYSDCNGHQFFSAPMILPEQLPLPSSPETLAPPDRQFTVPAKKTDDSDPACRPRLTADQTAILEEYYSHTPRPTTKQKREHAIRLGLTLEKVNVSHVALGK